MRRFDPRAWNLLGSSVLLSACGPDGIPTLEGFGDVADDADTTTDGIDPDVAESLDTGGCQTSADCPPGYYCDPYGVCQGGYVDTYEDWVDTNYTDYSDYPDSFDWYDEGPWYECYSDFECAQGYQCLYNSCLPYANPSPCGAFFPQEIPLPPMGAAIDLQLVDVSGDGVDDVVVLNPDGVTAVVSGVAIFSPFGGAPAQPLTRILLADLTGEGIVDIVALPEGAGEVWVGFGNNQGGFTWNGTIPAFADLHDVVAVD
ncbi:MAG: hypothetical protein KC457_24605, partial [Myxococcales bacterium]|nr:hypothetical protein [Myxococcales bacterium]